MFWVWTGIAIVLGVGVLAWSSISIARSLWLGGIACGENRATEVFDSAMTLLAKRVDDRRGAPQESQEQATKEVVQWAESVVGHWRRLKENPHRKR